MACKGVEAVDFVSAHGDQNMAVTYVHRFLLFRFNYSVDFTDEAKDGSKNRDDNNPESAIPNGF